MKLRGTRWQLYVMIACVLVCVFAFTAKLKQYESLHNQVTNVTSNKIWSSAEKRSTVVTNLEERPSFAPFAVLSLFLIVSFFADDRLSASIIDHHQSCSPSTCSAFSPALFRRPPPSIL
jgi:hypothetical protein